MKRILLIEDNSDIAQSIADILILSGYIVSVVTNGDKGQQSLFSYRPDLIISDILMPGMNGLELLDILRKDSVYRKIPFIILSGKTTDQDVQEGLGAGANIYLKKPCNADELVLSVSRLID
jgi:DNA-binding response OmpR family regulator